MLDNVLDEEGSNRSAATHKDDNHQVLVVRALMDEVKAPALHSNSKRRVRYSPSGEHADVTYLQRSYWVAKINKEVVEEFSNSLNINAASDARPRSSRR